MCPPPPYAPKSGQVFLATGARRVSTDPQSEGKKRAFDDKCAICFDSLGPDDGYFTAMKRTAFLVCSTMSVSKNGRRLAGQSLNVCFAVQWCYKMIR